MRRQAQSSTSPAACSSRACWRAWLVPPGGAVDDWTAARGERGGRGVSGGPFVWGDNISRMLDLLPSNAWTCSTQRLPGTSPDMEVGAIHACVYEATSTPGRCGPGWRLGDIGWHDTQAAAAAELHNCTTSDNWMRVWVHRERPHLLSWPAAAAAAAGGAAGGGAVVQVLLLRPPPAAAGRSPPAALRWPHVRLTVLVVCHGRLAPCTSA